MVTRRRPSRASARTALASPLRRVLQGPWPPWVGALGLVVLNALTLLVTGAPWGITTAPALVGSKLVSALGLAVASWPDWAGARGAVLRAPLLADATLVMDAGLVLGALLAAAVAGRFALRHRLPWSSVLAAVLGGVVMGYGVQLADGCNASPSVAHIMLRYSLPLVGAHARAVLAVLQEAVSPGEMQDLRAQLPQEWERLFAGREGSMPPAD